MDFAEMADDFGRLTAEIAYCTATTVDERHRPRSRVLHPIFEVVDGEPQGWAATDRTPVKVRHLAGESARRLLLLESSAEHGLDRLRGFVGHSRPETPARLGALRLTATCGLGRHVGLRS